MLYELAIVDRLMMGWRNALGADFDGYRHHVYRVVNLAHAFYPGMSDDEAQLLEVAAAFHDVGIWTHGTFDYLVPSADQACAYLAENPDLGSGTLADKQHLVQTMIIEHHRVRSLPGLEMPLAEAFRRGDWTDVTFGVRRFGLPWARVREIQAVFPDEGFHRRLMELFWARVREAPLSPLPMLRW